MGAVNYHTSDYVTLGVKPYDFDEMKKEMDDDVTDEEVNDAINDIYLEDRNNVQDILDNYSFAYFDVSIEPGYYEGFSINIEPSFDGNIYDDEDREDVVAEVADLRQLLKDLADIGLVACKPGWSTGYSDKADTIAKIDSAMDLLINEIMAKPLETFESAITESNADEKWRELTSIEDYEFDPDGKYDGSLYSDQWEEIFNELYQRAETTEEYLDNDWIDPVSTRNAYARRMEKNGHLYIVLKYYDGMYVLYEIKKATDTNESKKRTRTVIEKITKGVSVRQAITESVSNRRLFEDVAGMDQAEHDELMALLDKWTGGSGKNGWEYQTQVTNGGKTYAILIKKNPVAQFDGSVAIDKDGSILNGELYYKDADEFLAASGPVSLAGLKSILRDILSQVEMTKTDLMNSVADGDIYGY